MVWYSLLLSELIAVTLNCLWVHTKNKMPFLSPVPWQKAMANNTSSSSYKQLMCVNQKIYMLYFRDAIQQYIQQTFVFADHLKKGTKKHALFLRLWHTESERVRRMQLGLLLVKKRLLGREEKIKSEFSHLKVLLVLDRIPLPFLFFFCCSCNTKYSPAYAQELLQGEQKIPAWNSKPNQSFID